MNTNQIANANYEGPVIDVQFEGDSVRGKRYTYKAPSDDFQEGDRAVVPAGKGFKIAVVVEVGDETLMDLDFERQYAWAVSRIDTAAHDDRVEQDVVLLKRVALARRKSLRKTIKMQLGENGLLLPAEPRHE